MFILTLLQSIDVSYHVWYTLHIRLSQAMDWRRALEDNHYNNKEMWLLMLVLCKYCASSGSLTWEGYLLKRPRIDLYVAEKSC